MEHHTAGDPITGLKAELRAWKEAACAGLAAFRPLRKAPNSRVQRCDEGAEFLGLRVFPTHRRLNVSTARRAERRLGSAYRRIERRETEAAAFRPQSVAWLGHAWWENTRGLERRILEKAGSPARGIRHHRAAPRLWRCGGAYYTHPEPCPARTRSTGVS